MIVPVAVSATFAAVLALLAYWPRQKFTTLHGYYIERSSLPSTNLNACELVRGPAFCDDVVLHEHSGTAYMACDPTRPFWDPLRHVWEESGERSGGDVWWWKVGESAPPRKLALKGLPSGDQFHPLALSVIHSNISNPSSEEVLVLVSNHPTPGDNGVVDVFVHPVSPALDGLPAFRGNELVHIRRVQGEELEHQSPHRLHAVWDQPSLPVKATGLPAAHPSLRVPSFFFSTVPKVPARIWNYVPELLGYLFPTSAGVSYYHARAGLSRTVISGLETSTPFGIAIKVWDGGGPEAGSNSTSDVVFAASAYKGEVAEWSQHWVDTNAFREVVPDPSHSLLPTPPPPPAPQPGPRSLYTLKSVFMHTPSFVNFFHFTAGYPLYAIDVDKFGRLWGVSNRRKPDVDAWVEAVRSSNGSSIRAERLARRPGATVSQSTFVARLGGTFSISRLDDATVRPWEVAKLKEQRSKGHFVPKEWFTSTVFSNPGFDPPSAEGGSANGEGYDPKLHGFLPAVASALAIDLPGKRVIVVGGYEERGIALCEVPEGEAEMDS